MKYPFTTRETIIGLAGLAAGFVLGYVIVGKKVKDEYKDSLDRLVEQNMAEETEDDIPAPLPEENEEEDAKEEEAPEFDDETYDDYVDKVDANGYTVDDNRPEVTEDGTHVYHDGDFDMEIKQEPPKKHKKPKVLGAEKSDPDDPNTDYKAENLYYFMGSELLTDRWGHPVTEADTIGPNPRRYGFMNGQGRADTMWVRSYDNERDYLLHRKDGTTLDFFGSAGPGEEDEDEKIE